YNSQTLHIVSLLSNRRSDHLHLHSFPTRRSSDLDKVRITAQLIDAPADKHMWAKSYERDSRDVLALQDELASAIAREINVQLTRSEEHTSELQSLRHLVCRLLLEKKKKKLRVTMN